MSHVHQFRGTIGVQVSEEECYRDTDANFELDFGKPAPTLPNGVDERLYEPGVRHALLAKNDVVDGGPMPWPEGEQIIAKCTDLLRVQQLRQKEEMKLQIEKNRIGGQAK